MDGKHLQAEIEKDMNAFRVIQKEMQDLQQSRQQLTSQQNENEVVQKELGLLEGDAKVYKLVGPVLVEQELTEAKGNVDKRLEYINSEMSRLEKKAKDQEAKAEEKRKRVMEMQQLLQAQAAAAQAKA